MSPSAPRQPGEVYFVDFNPVVGSEQGGRRPAVIISVEASNKAFPVVTVAACSGQADKYRASALAVILPKDEPCSEETAVLPWQVRTVSTERLKRFVGKLSDQQLTEVRSRLKVIWGLK